MNRTVGAFGPVPGAAAPQLFDNLISLSADLAAKTPRISSNVEQLTNGMNRLMSPDNTRKLEDTIANADRTAANLAELTGSLQSSKAKVDNLLTTLDKAASENSEAVGQGLKDLRYSLQAVARNIDSVTYNLEGTARNMNEFSREIRQDPGCCWAAGPVTKRVRNDPAGSDGRVRWWRPVWRFFWPPAPAAGRPTVSIASICRRRRCCRRRFCLASSRSAA